MHKVKSVVSRPIFMMLSLFAFVSIQASVFANSPQTKFFQSAYCGQDYRYAVEKKIFAHSALLASGIYAKASVVKFSVSRDGTISGLRVSESSGSLHHDALVLKVVASSAPFARIPAVGPDHEEFRLVLNLNAHSWTTDCLPSTYEPGLDRLLRRLATSWHPPAQSEDTCARVTFKVDSSGRVCEPYLPSYGNSMTSWVEPAKKEFVRSVIDCANASCLTERCFLFGPGESMEGVPVEIDFSYVRKLGNEPARPSKLVSGCNLSYDAGAWARGNVILRDPPVGVASRILFLKTCKVVAANKFTVVP